MSVDLNDEILQDFLVEAGEILEHLNEQLVDLEQTPEDGDLLNSIFRGFHTIKGGASFLSLTNLVEVCHKSEDVFNLLRNDELELDADMMDAFLRVLDEVNAMFEQIRAGEDPSAAPTQLLQQLQEMQDPQAVADVEAAGDVVEAAAEETENVEATGGAADEVAASGEVDSVDSRAQDFDGDEITDDEFEALLDSLQGDDSGSGASEQDAAGQSSDSDTAAAADEISDDEFEDLLDSLHGKGSGPTGKAGSEGSEDVQTDESANAVDASAQSDEISDDEFEALLDNMHGKGKGPASSKKPGAEKAQAGEQNSSAPAAAAKVTSSLAADSKKPAACKAPAAPRITTAEATVRVDTARLDDIMNLVGELVLARNRLNTLKETFEDERVHQAIANLDVVTGDLQTAVMKTRMQPVKKVFGRFPRVVRDLARSLEKEISLDMVGEDTDLDKNLVEALADPLVHLVRNSVDHGIELPAVREAAGKPREGKVVLAAKQEGDNILLSISDDGAGMDPEVLRNKVVEKALMDSESASRLDDKGCFDLIFMPGLTTKQDISDVSGRGVGMDVVKTKITQLNGSIDIDSEMGKGTTLNIKVPLTLAILPTLMVQLGSRKYALPLSTVSEIFELSSKRTSIVDGREVVLNRGKAPPVFHLRKWLLNGSDASEPRSETPQVIMVQVANAAVGLVVDQVIGQEEVVIKPLGALLQGLPGMAGSTITGDGNIAIILDVQGLLKSYA
ncbi:MAG: chemotaxis protein CheA [Gammaproteobacteria bacterium]|nr:chemotaxis protein CheA [Gammaproteobacteria bacterium]